MTACDVYIGDLDDPEFHWEGGDWDGNVPRAIASVFPTVGGHYNECYHRWVGECGVECRQTDFGGWVARVTAKQLRDYIAYCYGTEPMYTDPKERKVWKHLVDRLDALRHFVADLDEEKQYALVATEF